MPWRIGRNKRVQVLLVTGRRSRRWLIPKGWPIAGKSLAEAAAVEAFEEAGVTGKVDPEPLGYFNHVKQRIHVGTMEVKILVHPLSVERELDVWPERGQRRRKWFSVEAATKRVGSSELSELILESVRRISSDI